MTEIADITKALTSGSTASFDATFCGRDYSVWAEPDGDAFAVRMVRYAPVPRTGNEVATDGGALLYRGTSAVTAAEVMLRGHMGERVEVRPSAGWYSVGGALLVGASVFVAP